MKKASKKPYRKPSLEKVQLITEESVLVTCKRGGGTGVGVDRNCMSGRCLSNAPS